MGRKAKGGHGLQPEGQRLGVGRGDIPLNWIEPWEDERISHLNWIEAWARLFELFDVHLGRYTE